jgi:hypothetical protein
VCASSSKCVTCCTGYVCQCPYTLMTSLELNVVCSAFNFADACAAARQQHFCGLSTHNSMLLRCVLRVHKHTRIHSISCNIYVYQNYWQCSAYLHSASYTVVPGLQLNVPHSTTGKFMSLLKAAHTHKRQTPIHCSSGGHQPLSIKHAVS